MQRFVSQDCLDCILEDIRETHQGEPCEGEAVSVHPLVLQRIIAELMAHRRAYKFHPESFAA